MPLHAQREGLEAAQGEERIERAGHRADGVLQKSQPLGELRISAHHQHAVDDVRVAAEILGARVHDQVEAELERPLQVGSREGVVGGRENAATACERGDRRSGRSA